MAQMVYRRPNDPPKKEMATAIARKKRNRHLLLWTLYIIQTLATIGYIYGRL